MQNKCLTYAASALAGVVMTASIGTTAFSQEPKSLEDGIKEKIEYIQTFQKNFFKGKNADSFSIVLNDNDYDEINKLTEEQRKKHAEDRTSPVSDGFLEKALVQFSDFGFQLSYLPFSYVMLVFNDYLPYGLDFDKDDIFMSQTHEENKKIIWTFENGKYKREYDNSVRGDKIEGTLKVEVDKVYDSALSNIISVLKERYGDKYNK